jgi:transcriptional regulator with XRE-family HTH domain
MNDALLAPQLYFAHAHEDREMARPLAEKMMAQGIDVWFDQWEIKIGDSLRRKMESGLSTCTHFLVLLTPHSIGKPWVETEIDAGFLKSVGGQARFLGIRVGVPIDKLSPFLQTVRCPEIDLADDGQISSLIGDIHGTSTKPALGAPPAFARKAPTRIGRWSDAATVVAEYLVRNSKLGVKFDPQTNPAKVSAATGLPEALAHECGINRTYLSEVERSERNVSIDNISRIARGLKLSLRCGWMTVLSHRCACAGSFLLHLSHSALSAARSE